MVETLSKSPCRRSNFWSCPSICARIATSSSRPCRARRLCKCCVCSFKTVSGVLNSWLAMLSQSALSGSASVQTKVSSTICYLSNLILFSIMFCPLPGSCYAEWSLDALCVKRLHYHGSDEYEQPERFCDTEQPGLW